VFHERIPRADRLFRCCQRSIIIWSAPSAEQAAEAAKKEFAELEGIRDWKIHASLIEVEAIDLEAEPETPSLKRRPDHENDVGRRQEPGPGHASTERHGKRRLPMHARPPHWRRPGD
jgi:hypothetical protein